METAKHMPVVRFHPKAPSSTPEQVRRALGTIPYHGPVLPTTLFDDRPEPSRPAERARD